MDRQLLKLTSNNRENPNQNMCAMAVANALGVKDENRAMSKLHLLMVKHWAGMLADEQIDAWANEDIWGENYQMDAAHVEESVRYFLAEVEEKTELTDMYELFIDDVDWEALKDAALKIAVEEWNNPKNNNKDQAA